MLIRLLLLGALLPWHANSPSGRAPLFAGVYTAALAVLGLLGMMGGGSLVALAVGSMLHFALAFIYFWLLDRFNGPTGWLITLVGALALSFV